MKNFKMEYLKGWFGEESDFLGTFRWTGKKAGFRIYDLRPVGKKYLCFSAGHSFSDQEFPELKVFINGKKAGSKKISSAFSVYGIPFDESGEVIIEFVLDRVFNIPGDGRNLGIMVRDLDIVPPDEMDLYADGWYLPDKNPMDKRSETRWMKKEALCVIGPAKSEETSFLVITCGHPYPNAINPKLELKIEGKIDEVFEVFPEQNRILVPLENVSGYVEVELYLDKVFDRSGTKESRELGMLVSKIELLASDAVETYFEGWYPPEKESRDFVQDRNRWMKQQAVCIFTGLTEKAFRYLILDAGHPFPNEADPELSILVSGESKAVFKIRPGERKYLVPLGITEDFIRIDLKLNKTFPPSSPEDKRTLGILVKKIDVRVPSEIETFFEGWYKPELSDQGPRGIVPRWMKKQGICFFSDLDSDQRRYIILQGGHPFSGEEDPILKVQANGQLKGEAKIQGENRVYIFPLGYTRDHIQVDFQLDRVFKPPHEDDKRELGILMSQVEVVSLEDEKILIPNNCDGWHEWEKDNFYEFIWISKTARSSISPHQAAGYRYISFFAFSEFMDFSQKLKLKLNGDIINETPLLHKWNFYSIELKKGLRQNPTAHSAFDLLDQPEIELEFSVNKLFPTEFHPNDNRNLGVRIAEVRLHDDEEIHENFLYFHHNAFLNYKEMIEGRSILDSYPLNLGIDLYGQCNIKPPCVYCLWDSMKELEGEYCKVTVDEKTLEGYGPFFKSARTLVNCSFGEPLLHPRFTEILELCAEHNKYLEISTNGQAFTRRTIQALVGKPIFLYVSLDAATKETYAKIRNDKWDPIVPNLELLNRERKKHNNFPKINMVFMPMKVNRNDLEEYFRLCKRIQADALVLRPLLYLWEPKIEKDRGGYHFNYKDELLPRKELEEIFRQCDLFSKRYGVPVANQFEFGTIKEPGKETSTDFYFEFQRS